MLTGIGGFLILVRLLPEAQMGSWALYLTVTAMAEVIRNSLFKNGLIRYLHNSPAEEQASVRMAALLLNGGAALQIAALILLFSPWLSTVWSDPGQQELLNWHLLVLPVLVVFSHIEALFQTRSNFRNIFLMYLFRQGILFGAICVYALLGWPVALVHLIWFQIAGSALGVLLGWKMLPAEDKTLDYQHRGHWQRELWAFGRFVFGTNIASQIFRSADQLLVGAFGGPAVVAYYNASIRITNLLDTPTTAIAEVLYTKTAAASGAGQHEKIRMMYYRTVGYTVALLLPVCVLVWLFAELAILIFAGERYLPAVPVLKITLWYALLLPFMKQFGTVMDAVGHPKVNFMVTLFTSVVCLALAWGFLQLFGIVGAAMGILTGYAISVAVNQIVLRRYLQIELHSLLGAMAEVYRVGWQLMTKRKLG